MIRKRLSVLQKLQKIKKVGARALRSIVETIMIDPMFNLPGGKKQSLNITIKDIKEFENRYLSNQERKTLAQSTDK